jgi:predicted acetyltransferase
MANRIRVTTTMSGETCPADKIDRFQGLSRHRDAYLRGAMLDYGTPDQTEAQEQKALLNHAFAVPVAELEKSLQWAGHENLRVVREHGGVVGCMTLVRMGQFFGGKSVPMVGVAGVAVRPDAARRGVATALMRESMRELAREGVALSTLYASTQTLYRKVGFEAAGSRFEARVPPTQIEIASHDPPLRRAVEADRPAIEAFYAARAADRPGHLDRGPYIWNRTLLERFGNATHGVLVADDDRIEGYVFYRKVSSDPPYHDMIVTDLQASTARAYRRLWSFMRDISTSVVSEIVLFTAPSDPAYLVHPHPYFRMRLTDNWMLRIVDAAAALAARGYPPHVDGELHLELADDLVTANAGRWVLRVRDGAATVGRGGEGRFRLDVRGLAALYSGFTTPRDLARLDRLDADAASMAIAETIFSGPPPWMPDMF